MTKLQIRPIEGDKMLKGMHEAACPKCGWRIQAYSTPGEAFDLAPEDCPSCIEGGEGH